MASCLLSDSPAPAFQAVLHCLESSDVANLRLVSHLLSTRTTQHTPYIILRLSPSTGREQLRQWCQATRRLQHVSNIHVHISGKITPEVFDLALKLISLRGCVEELQLLGSSSNGSSRSGRMAAAATPYGAYIPTLYPIHYLGSQLKSLAVKGLAVTDLPSDLSQLAAAAAAAEAAGGGGHQPILHTLDLSAAWNNQGTARLSEFVTVMTQLPHTFPRLKNLLLHLPYLVPELPAAAAAAGGTAAVAALPASEVAAAALQQQMRAAVAALATGLTRLQQLETVTITAMPDIWASPAAPAAAAATAAVNTAAPADAGGVDLFSAAAAAAVSFPRTLDVFGGWLLQQLPRSQEAHISTVGTNWTMSWQQEQVSSRHNITSTLTAARCRINSIKATYHAGLPPVRATPANHTVSNSSSSSSGTSLVEQFTRQLCHYSSRPPSALMRHISSCQLAIHPSQTASLASLLTQMTTLRHLKVTLLTTSSQHSTATSMLAAAVAAAAAVKGLQSLTLLPGMSPVFLNPDLLMPLTAAAEGPGSSLKKIRLVGTFRTPLAAAAAAPPMAAAAALGWHALRQLDGLQDLCIHQMGTELLDFPADCLPASLEVFVGRRLSIVAAAAAAGSGSVISQDSHSATELTAAAAGSRPQLHALHLQLSQLGDPSILASERLTSLTVASSSWSGGWAAAAAAWPATKQLSWLLEHNSNISRSVKSSKRASPAGGSQPQTVQKGSHSSRGMTLAAPSTTGKIKAAAPASCPARKVKAAAAADDASRQQVQDITQAFSKLEKLIVQGQPCSIQPVEGSLAVV